MAGGGRGGGDGEDDAAGRAAREKVDAEIDALVGMGDAKELLEQLRRKVQYFQRGGRPEVLQTCLNLVLTGNPGTGNASM